jgi:hypothetical protein
MIFLLKKAEDLEIPGPITGVSLGWVFLDEALSSVGLLGQSKRPRNALRNNETPRLAVNAGRAQHWCSIEPVSPVWSRSSGQDSGDGACKCRRSDPV